MSSKPLKNIQLRKKLSQEKPFLLQIRKAKTNQQLRFLITNATNQQIRLLQSLVISYFSTPEIPISPLNFKRLKLSRKLAFIKKHFQPTKILSSVAEARATLHKMLQPLKILVSNILDSSRQTSCQ